MSEVVNEFLVSQSGILLLESLAKQRNKYADMTMDAARRFDHSIEVVRYRAGMADGLQLAINTLIEMGR